METAASAYGGILLLVTDDEDPETPIKIVSSSSGIKNPDDPDLLQDLNELCNSEDPEVIVNDTPYTSLVKMLDPGKYIIYQIGRAHV